MRKQYYKTPNSEYAIVYPTKAIYVHGSRVSPNVLVCGYGPDATGKITDQVFQVSDLGQEVTESEIPDEWKEALGLIQPIAQLADEVHTTVGFNFDNSDRALVARVLVGSAVGFIIGLILTYLNVF
jgi:hypothetical protein